MVAIIKSILPPTDIRLWFNPELSPSDSNEAAHCIIIVNENIEILLKKFVLQPFYSGIDCVLIYQ